MVGAERGIHRSEIELALILVRRGRDIPVINISAVLMITLKAGTLRSCASKSSKALSFSFKGTWRLCIQKVSVWAVASGNSWIGPRRPKIESGVSARRLILIEIP